MTAVERGTSGPPGMRWRGDRLQGIVLAGGDGERLQGLVGRWLGHLQPKQYCTFVGTRSMFQHTVDRARRLIAPERIVVVAAATHGEVVQAQLEGRRVGRLLLQPRNRETAAGIFLPLTYIRAADPQATVVVFPSDHFISPEPPFLEAVGQVARVAEWFPDRVVLVGVRPDRPEPAYGWVEPGRDLVGPAGPSVREVRRFVEKPDPAEAVDLMAAGGLWNTLIFAARVDTLWAQGRQCFPEMLRLFERLADALGTAAEGDVLAEIYEAMPAQNFSSGLLERLPEQVAVVESDGFVWSDWGEAERIVETLLRMGRRPAFPVELVEAARGGAADARVGARPGR